MYFFPDFVQNTNEWDELLPFVLFACIQVPHEETGFAPFELLYGWPVRGPTQLFMYGPFH
jgi:hypothetical protein